MKILALDSSSNVASAALMDNGILLGEYSVNYKQTHSQTLLPMIDTLLKVVEADVEAVDLFAVANGPGSFTGLRIGLATVKGLAHACNKPVVGVSTLLALAYNLPHCDGLVAPILDARRDQVYTAVYQWENGVIKTHTEPCAVSIDSLLDILQKAGQKAVFLGDGIARFGDRIRETLGSMAYFAPGSAALQRASSVAAAAQTIYAAGGAVACSQLLPVYLRKSQAEREYEEKQKRTGNQEEKI